MSKEVSVILLGAAVIVIPYLGIPSLWRTLLLVLVGLTIILIGFLLRSQGMRRPGKTSPYQPFVENVPNRGSDAAQIARDYSQHEHKEGITSLN